MIEHRNNRNPDSTFRSDALVFTEKVKGALRIAAGDRKAHELGLVGGLALADARARIPALEAVEMDVAADRALLEDMADFCDRYTPLVSIEGADGLVLDITGCAHLFGGEGALRGDLCRRLAGAGMTVRATIADTPEGAAAFARHSRHEIVETGRQAVLALPLPVHALGLPGETLTALSRAGLKTVGDLADRAAPAIASRFGAHTISRLDALLARRDMRITPRRQVPAAMAERRFGEPIASEEVALDTLSSLATQIAGSLEARGQGARGFEAGFFRTDGRVIRIAVGTARPVRDPRIVMRLFREKMDALADPLDPGFGFDMIRLGAHGCEASAPVQQGFDTNAAEEEEVAALLDRLAARFGHEAVLRFQASDTHIPERAERLVPAAHAAWQEDDIWHIGRGSEPPARPITLFSPPQPIETAHEVPDGPPLFFRWRRVAHRIVHAEGPERIAAEWWRQPEALPARDYYRIEDETGHRFWVFREGLHGEGAAAPRWYLHGKFA